MTPIEDKQKIKYLIKPGHVVSKHDGDTHFIAGRRLIELYGLNPKDCLILKHDTGVMGFKGRLIEVRPDPSGIYDINNCEEIEL